MSLLTHGYRVYGAEAETLDWCESVLPQTRALSQDPDLRAKWLRHGGTWFVGVDVLPNDADGAVQGGRGLGGQARQEAEALYGALALHRAQISVTYPGYPRCDPGESAAAHRFRRDRDGAHVDGLLPVGAAKRRFAREFHAYILGICLTDADAAAAPLVVWEGSHTTLRAAFKVAFDRRPEAQWPDVDLTEIYQSTRRSVFETCPRRELPLRRGEAVLVHRHALHGIAPWTGAPEGNSDGRTIAYFRPVFTDPLDWIVRP